MIFVDTSALIAVIAGEDDADTLADRLDADRDRLCSAISVWETVAGLCRSYAFSVPAARAQVARFVEAGGISMTGIGERELQLALGAETDLA